MIISHPIMHEHILTDFHSIVMFLEQTSHLFHEAAYNRVQSRKQPVTPNFYVRASVCMCVYLVGHMAVWTSLSCAPLYCRRGDEHGAVPESTDGLRPRPGNRRRLCTLHFYYLNDSHSRQYVCSASRTVFSPILLNQYLRVPVEDCKRG